MGPTCFLSFSINIDVASSISVFLLDSLSAPDSFSRLFLSRLKLSIPRKEEFSIFAEFSDGLELLESVDWKKERKKEEIGVEGK